MKVGIFWVHAMEYMCVQTRPDFMLSSERVVRSGESELLSTPRDKHPQTDGLEEGQTCDAASHTTASQTHYQAYYSCPLVLIWYGRV